LIHIVVFKKILGLNLDFVSFHSRRKFIAVELYCRRHHPINAAL